MFVRVVTMPLKPGAAEKYAEAVEHYAIPVLRKQKGFVEQLGLVTADGKTSIGITLWESEKDEARFSTAGGLARSGPVRSRTPYGRV